MKIGRRWVATAVTVALVGSLLGLSAAVVEGVAPAGSPVAAPVASAAPVDGGLGYTALPTPCRAVDTRAAGVPGGDLTAGETRDFQMRGSTTFAAQGGSPTGCGVPSTAAAVEVSITAVTPSGANGFVRAFPAGSSVNAAFLNYTVGRGITNTGTVPLNTGVTNDLGVANFGGVIHVIVDIQGYFAPSGGASYVPLASSCRVVDTRNAGGTITAGGSRAFQVAGSGANFSAQGGTAGGCGVPDGVVGIEVSVTVTQPVGDGFVRVAPNDLTQPTAAFVNYTNGTGITNTGTITPSNLALLDIVVRNLGGSTHVIIDVQGYFTTTPGQGTRYQTVTPCRTVDTRNAGRSMGPDAVRSFQTAGSRVGFRAQGGSSVTGCGVPQRAAAVEVSLTAVSPTGAGFTRPAPAGLPPTSTFLNYTAVGGITNTGTLVLPIGGLNDLSVKNFGGGANYLVDVLGYFEPPDALPRSTEGIALGDGHTCSLVGGGRVQCWGDNSDGQVGDGTVGTFPVTPVAVPGITDAVQVAAGGHHSCALRAAGSVSCWGDNSDGQVGDGTSVSRPSPTVVAGLPALPGAASIVLGDEHSCALMAGGTVQCWGDNSQGQLGRSTTEDSARTPAPVTGLTDVVQISAGADSTCAVLTDGTARCWGWLTRSSTPSPVAGLSNVLSISTSRGDPLLATHSCALLADSSVWCWGQNQVGQLGDGTTSDRATPAPVPGITGALAVTTGDDDSCALLALGVVRCWGFNSSGQLGDGSTTNRTTPVTVATLTGATQIVAGHEHTCAVTRDGTTLCWGDDSLGGLGDGSGTPALAGSPVEVSGFEGAVQVGAGSAHSCALLAEGTVECWGTNSFGQLGDGSTTQRTTPVRVSGISGAVEIAVGDFHTCAVLSSGRARCWGLNLDGRIGDGSTTNRTTPVDVSGLTDVLSLDAGNAHTCAVLADGTARCWGANTAGQLGDSSTTQRTAPVTVSGLTGARQVSAGGTHTCAVLADGTARCWGSNGSTQLGDGSGSGLQTTPTAVLGLFDARVVAAGTNHTCAFGVVNLPASGTCWGSNGSGQLGTNFPDDAFIPVRISGLETAVRFAAGTNHSCAALSDGSARCWGGNVGGQIGDGTTIQRNTPVTVVDLG